MSILLSKKHGVNPAIPVCFFCGEEKNEVILAGKMKYDAEAPKHAVWDKKPCDKCRELMEMGVMLISVKGDYRKHKCECGNGWDAPVILSKETQNISGEASAFCPKCGKKACYGSPVIHEDRNNPYRTGNIAVIKVEAAKRIFGESIGNSRVAFLEDAAWERLGLPKENK